MRKHLLSLAFLMGLSAFSDAEIENHDLWTGVNGKVFRADFDQVLPDGLRAQFFNPKGERIIVEIAKLIQRDRELISGSQKKAEPDVAIAAGDPSAFKPEAAPDRTVIPQLDPKKFGASAWEAMVDSMWVSLLWWERTNVLEVPKKGDFERKAEWLHKELTRKIATAGKSAVSLEETQKGLEEYFLENLKEVAACRITVEKKDLSFDRLGALCRGANAVILKMTMIYANGRDFSVCTVLESIGDGRFAFHVFGKRFAGVVKTVPATVGKKPEAEQLEFVLENPRELPAQYATNEPRFFLGGNSWNGALVLKPYIYLVPGKISPLPPAEEIRSAKKEPEISARPPERVFEPRFPIQFTSPVQINREWNLIGGRKFLGYPVERKGKLPVLRNVKGEELEVTDRDFGDEDRARFCFWEASLGNPQSPPRLDLRYQYNTSKRGSFEVKVATEGTLGRVDFPSDRSSLTFDMADGAFLSTRVNIKEGKETVSRRWGRIEPEHLLPSEVPHFYEQDDLDRFSANTLPGSAKSQSTNLPSRFMDYPLRVIHKTMQNTRIDFVLMEQPVVLAGLYQLLCITPPGRNDRSFVFSHYRDIPWHKSCAQIFPILSKSRMMPVKLSWVNWVDEGITDKVQRAESAGAFSLELIRAAVPDGFSEGHFDLPAEARLLPLGTSKSNY